MIGSISESEWRFDTSSGISVGASMLVGVGVSVASIALDSPSFKKVYFSYVDLGIGIGVGAPVQVTYSTESMPSAGNVYAINNAAGRELTANDFEGLAVIGEVSEGLFSMFGHTGTVMFMGIKRVPSTLFDVAVGVTSRLTTTGARIASGNNFGAVRTMVSDIDLHRLMRLGPKAMVLMRGCRSDLLSVRACSAASDW